MANEKRAIYIRARASGATAAEAAAEAGYTSRYGRRLAAEPAIIQAIADYKAYIGRKMAGFPEEINLVGVLEDVIRDPLTSAAARIQAVMALKSIREGTLEGIQVPLIVDDVQG